MIYSRAIFAGENPPELRDKIICVNEYETFNERIDACSRSITRQPESHKYWFYRGYHRFYTKQYQLAIEDFTQALTIYPNIDCNYYYYRGMAFGKIQNYHKALQDLNKALEIDPEFED